MAQQWIDNALDTLAGRMAAAGRAPLGYRKNGQPIWPMFGASPDDAGSTGSTGSTGTGDGSTGGAGSGSDGSSGAGSGADAGFPQGVPITEMTVEQREAYWKHQSRRHEQRVRDLGGVTPEELAELRKKAKAQDELELELGTTADKAAAKAAEEARAAVRAEMQPEVISARLDAAAARAGVSSEDLDKALAFVDTTKFIGADGKLDTAKVSAFISTIKPVTGTSLRKGPTVMGHGLPSGSDGASTALTGREMFAQRHAKNTKA